MRPPPSPHIAAGQAKACADAWKLHDAPAAEDGHVVPARARWEETEVSLAADALSRTRATGARISSTGRWCPGDIEWKLTLWDPGN